MNADHHGDQDVRYGITYVVQPSAKRTAKPQLLGQNPVQIIHDVVEHDERTEIQKRISLEEDAKGQHT